MATMVVLLEAAARDVTMDCETVAELAQHGIKNLALVQDDQAVGIVLEGWAFEPEVSAAAVVSLLARRHPSVRALHPLGQMAVWSHRQEGVVQ